MLSGQGYAKDEVISEFQMGRYIPIEELNTLLSTEFFALPLIK